MTGECFLPQITSETEDAYSKTNKTVTEVEAFQNRLNKLNSALIKNQGEVKDLSDAADGVAETGETVRKNVAELRKEYDAAIAKVDQDYDQTGDIKRQADELLLKASELSFNTKTKLEQLKGTRLYYNVVEVLHSKQRAPHVLHYTLGNEQGMTSKS